MALFSQRQGYTPLNKAFQYESVDQELRNRLWNIFKIFVWDYWQPYSYPHPDNELLTNLVENFVKEYWHSFFKEPLDNIPTNFDKVYNILRNYFLYDAEWYQIYDFVEFGIKKLSF